VHHSERALRLSASTAFVSASFPSSGACGVLPYGKIPPVKCPAKRFSPIPYPSLRFPVSFITAWTPALSPLLWAILSGAIAQSMPCQPLALWAQWKLPPRAWACRVPSSAGRPGLLPNMFTAQTQSWDWEWAWWYSKAKLPRPPNLLAAWTQSWDWEWAWRDSKAGLPGCRVAQPAAQCVHCPDPVMGLGVGMVGWQGQPAWATQCVCCLDPVMGLGAGMAGQQGQPAWATQFVCCLDPVMGLGAGVAGQQGWATWATQFTHCPDVTIVSLSTLYFLISQTCDAFSRFP
jgi:hypothetical protein